MSGEWKTGLAILVYVLLAVVGDVLISRGMRQMKALKGLQGSEVGRFYKHVVTNATVLAGVGCLALNFVMLLALYTGVALSVVNPSRAASYLFLTLLAKFWLRENVTPRRWIGVVLITLGVALVMWTEEGSSRGAPPKPAEVSRR